MSGQRGAAHLSRTTEMAFTSPGRASRAPRRPVSRSTSAKRTRTGSARINRKRDGSSTSDNMNGKENTSCTTEEEKKEKKAEIDAAPKPEVEDDHTGSETVDGPTSTGADSEVTELLEKSDQEQKSNQNEAKPEPEVVKEEMLPATPVANRPLTAYSDVVGPEDFDSKFFLSSVSDLSAKLSEEQYWNLDPDISTTELEAMVTAVSSTLSSFHGFTVHAQARAEELRNQMKSVKDHMLKKVQQNAYKPSSAPERFSIEEQDLEAKLAQLNNNLARTAEELARACAVSAETEIAATEAALVAARASAKAARSQAEYEARRNAEQAKQREEEARRCENEARQRATVERVEHARQEEEERRARLRRGDRETQTQAPAWESWPVYSYCKAPGEFDHGVVAMIRADPTLVKESWIRAEVLDQAEAGFVYENTEQLVSNIVRMRPVMDGDLLPAPVVVVLPHCTSRASAMTREPIIKALIDSAWVELRSHEVTIEDKKEVKFVQAEVAQFTTLAVVTRFRRDFLQMSRRGGKETSNVDSRVTFLAKRGTFKHTENFVLQLQPVDSVTMTEMKADPEAAGLLCASSVVNVEWTSSCFQIPITVTLPCPPNPVKAKKAAAIRAAKEAKVNTPVSTAQRLREEEARKEESENQPTPRKNRWYMGQYSSTDDDDNDILHMVSKKKGRWRTVGGVDILQVRLDLLQFDLASPIDTFMVLRTRPTVTEKEALRLARMIESQLSQSLVIAVIKQSEEEFTDMRLSVVPLTKSDRIMQELENEGYALGPAPSAPLRLREGDLLTVNFRGNITRQDDPPSPPGAGTRTLIYNSNLGTWLDFRVREVDRFLQKNYGMFRGFVQVLRESCPAHSPTQAVGEAGRGRPGAAVSKELLAELLITIPKDRPSSPVRRPVISKAPIVIRNVNDPINEDTLREVAAELGDEWKLLAECLNVTRMRIEAILRNCNENEDEELDLQEARFKMLLTWVKRVPRSVSKVPILCQALVHSGRADLAERLADMDKEFQRQRRGP